MDYILSPETHYFFSAYLAIFLIAFLESLAFVGIAIPGTIFVILVGFLAAKGFFPLAAVIVLVTLGAIIGDATSYYFGSNIKVLFKKNSRFLKSKFFRRGEKFFIKHGHKSVLLGRIAGPIRSIVPFVAGIFKMDINIFFTWSISSAFVWAIALSLFGFFFGSHF